MDFMVADTDLSFTRGLLATSGHLFKDLKSLMVSE